MITIKKINERRDIEYTKGDTFAINISTDDTLAEGTTLRLQISPSGDVNDILIEKTYQLNNDNFEVNLSDAELKHLYGNNEYEYRLSLIDINGTIVTTESGNLIVKWGA